MEHYFLAPFAPDSFAAISALVKVVTSVTVVKAKHSQVGFAPVCEDTLIDLLPEVLVVALAAPVASVVLVAAFEASEAFAVVAVVHFLVHLTFYILPCRCLFFISHISFQKEQMLTRSEQVSSA